MILRAIVDLPEPVPPAIPIINLLSFIIGRPRRSFDQYSQNLKYDSNAKRDLIASLPGKSQQNHPLLRIAGYHYWVILFLLFLSHRSVFAQTLEQKWDFEKIGFTSNLEPNLLAGKHILFIAGIMNELASMAPFISAYYQDNMEIAKDLGGTTSYFGPASEQSIPYNARILYQKILTLWQGTKKPLIIIAHSKGGAEALYAILKHPELITHHIVEKVILIQPAIGGSPLAENTCTWCVDLISTFAKPNLKTLNVSTAKSNFDHAFRFFEDRLARLAKTGKFEEIKTLKQNISNRIFYVRGQQEYKRLSLGVTMVLGICTTTLYEHGKNDGLLLVDAQMDPRIGIDLGILHVDHIGLTVSSVSNTTQQERKAFTRALFAKIYEPTFKTPTYQ